MIVYDKSITSKRKKLGKVQVRADETDHFSLFRYGSAEVVLLSPSNHGSMAPRSIFHTFPLYGSVSTISLLTSKG